MAYQGVTARSIAIGKAGALARTSREKCTGITTCTVGVSVAAAGEAVVMAKISCAVGGIARGHAGAVAFDRRGEIGIAIATAACVIVWSSAGKTGGVAHYWLAVSNIVVG